LKKTKVFEPDICLARNDTRFPDDRALEGIIKYKDDVRYDQQGIPGVVKQIFNDLQMSADVTQEIVSSTSDKVDKALDRLEKIDNNTKPKKRKTNKAQILRDPVPNSMLEDILKAAKPKGAHQLTWSRFQLASVILFFSGLKINEITCIRKEMVQSITDSGHQEECDLQFNSLASDLTQNISKFIDILFKK
jgi:hypothetical protein